MITQLCKRIVHNERRRGQLRRNFFRTIFNPLAVIRGSADWGMYDSGTVSYCRFMWRLRLRRCQVYSLVICSPIRNQLLSNEFFFANLIAFNSDLWLPWSELQASFRVGPTSDPRNQEMYSSETWNNNLRGENFCWFLVPTGVPWLCWWSTRVNMDTTIPLNRFSLIVTPPPAAQSIESHARPSIKDSYKVWSIFFFGYTCKTTEVFRELRAAKFGTSSADRPSRLHEGLDGPTKLWLTARKCLLQLQ